MIEKNKLDGFIKGIKLQLKYTNKVTFVDFEANELLSLLEDLKKGVLK